MKYDNGKIVYETGDYVYLFNNDYGVGLPINQVYTLERDGTGIVYILSKAVNDRQIRPATQQEIEEYLKKEQKHEYQIGDYIVMIKDCIYNSGKKKGMVLQVRAIDRCDKLDRIHFSDGYCTHTDCIRLAEPEEIEKATKFKVGDWVVILSNKHYGKIPIGTVTQIVSIGHNPEYRMLPYKGSDWHYAGDGDIRLATPDEVREAQKPKSITLGKHTVQFDSGGLIIGCKTIPYVNHTQSQLRSFINLLNNLGFKDGRFADTTITMEELLKLEHSLKE